MRQVDGTTQRAILASIVIARLKAAQIAQSKGRVSAQNVKKTAFR